MVKWNINERYPWSKVASFDGDASTEEVMTFRIYFDLDDKDGDGDDDKYKGTSLGSGNMLPDL